MTKIKDRRREVRLSADDDALINEAAALSGTTFTGFVLEDAVARAREVVDAHRTIALPDDVYDRFLQALDEPAKRVPGLVELSKRAKRLPRLS